jgi:hypothetical protein
MRAGDVSERFLRARPSRQRPPPAHDADDRALGRRQHDDAEPARAGTQCFTERDTAPARDVRTDEGHVDRPFGRLDRRAGRVAERDGTHARLLIDEACEQVAKEGLPFHDEDAHRARPVGHARLVASPPRCVVVARYRATEMSRPASPAARPVMRLQRLGATRTIVIPSARNWRAVGGSR